MIWALVFPALIKEIIELFPFTQFEYGFKLKLYNLKML